MFQCQIPICGLPVNLVLLSGGTIVFIRVGPVGVIFDQPETGIGAILHDDRFFIDNVEYSYNTIYQYKQIPSMLTWLQQQSLMEPA